MPGQTRSRKESGTGEQTSEIKEKLLKTAFCLSLFFPHSFKTSTKGNYNFHKCTFFTISHLQFHLFYQAGKNRTGMLSYIL